MDMNQVEQHVTRFLNALPSDLAETLKTEFAKNPEATVAMLARMATLQWQRANG